VVRSEAHGLLHHPGAAQSRIIAAPDIRTCVCVCFYVIWPHGTPCHMLHALKTLGSYDCMQLHSSAPKLRLDLLLQFRTQVHIRTNSCTNSGKVMIYT